MKKILNYMSLMILLTVISSISVSGQNISLSVTPQHGNKFYQGQLFQVSVTVSNGDAPISRSDAPKIEGCRLMSGPSRTTSFSAKIVGNQSTSSASVIYTFTYQANTTGTVTIPPVRLNVNGHTMQTSGKSINILPADQNSQANNSYSGYGNPGMSAIEEMEAWLNDMRNGASQSSGGNVGSNRSQQPAYTLTPQPVQQPKLPPSGKVNPNDFIVTVNVSKTDVYEKEALIATVKLYTRHNVLKFQPTVMPQFEGFLSEEIDVGDPTPVRETFRGTEYYSLILKKCLLFPQKSGRLTINSGTYDVTLQTFDVVQEGSVIYQVPKEHNITTTSNSVSVNVKSLPTPVPASFNGAVGNFQVSTSLSPQQLRTNEAAKYTLTVTGVGNLNHLAEPIVPLPATVEEYAPVGQSDAKFNGSNLEGTYTATYTFIPQQTGTLNIPSWEFTYFDPSTGKYVTTALPAYSTNVTKGVAAKSGSSSGSAMDMDQIKDIRHIQTVNESDLKPDHKPLFHKFIYWISYVLVILALVITLYQYQRNLKANADVQGMRIRKARSVATKRLRKANVAMEANKSEEFYAALSSALWGFLSDKLKIAASSLTRENISEKLEEADADQNLITRTIDLLDECEIARFTPNHSQNEMSTLYGSAANVIDSLNKLKSTTKPKEETTVKSRYGI